MSRLAVLALLAFSLGARAADCVPVASWVAPGAPPRTLEPATLIASAASRRAVLLGELHDNAEHHRWQLQTLAALHGRHPAMVLGFESFPRRVQPVLERWVAGELSEREFLEAVDWRSIWAFDPKLYLPLFHFARMHRIPMVALNVDRDTTRAVSRLGFDALSPAEREHVTRPAPPSEPYLDLLYQAFTEHAAGAAKPPREAVAFRRFVESQTVWDRAMAQALAEALAAHPGALAVGIMGRQHLAHGYGVPHQLADLGVREAAVLLPWDRDTPCGELEAGLADAVFGLAAPQEASEERPRLGVAIEPAEGGVRIASVEKGSLAEAAGLRAGDLVVEVAGRAARQPADLAEAVARQAPGTWLPLRVRREGAEVELVAKFPPAAQAPHYDLSLRIEKGELHGRALLRSRSGATKEVRWQRPLPADPRGFHLAAGSGWHPELDRKREGELASYRVFLDLPAGQVGLVPGTLVEEAVEGGRYRVRFEFPHPAPGLDLMVGPYRIESRDFSTPQGERIRLRTYFHPEVAALAPGYLDAVQGYLALYERAIGAYPFGEFSVVSSPTPTGYGMPTLAYLGTEVLKLPFIRATSLGHEVLHNWWGNGVYPDYASGNWAEALTTFMADYAYKERESAQAAREMRLAWLRDLAALPAAADFPLREFVERTHSATQIVGYRKGAMVFFMLREALGAETFDAALRAFWREHRFRVAGWADLERAFERASGRRLERFFAQWLERSGLPAVRIAQARAAPAGEGWRVTFTLAQEAPAYALAVPVVLRTEQGEEVARFDLDHPSRDFEWKTEAKPLALVLDPEARVLRRLAPGEAPPILRRVAVDAEVRSVFPSGALPEARALAERLTERAVRGLAPHAPPGEAPLLVIGLQADVDAWLSRHGLPPRPARLDGKGSAQAWTAARSHGEPMAVVSARDAAALQALLRPLPHYGAQSYVAFEGGRALERGVWPSQPQAWALAPEPGR